VAEPIFSDFGGLHAFHGPIATIKVFEDNAVVRTLLEEAGDVRILVIDGGGSMRCALIGGNLATLAVTNGCRGAIVNGCVRDADEIRATALGVKALAPHPRKSEKGLHTGHRDIPVHFAGVLFTTHDPNIRYL
jgi:regulator of ribonuclease activity A